MAHVIVAPGEVETGESLRLTSKQAGLMDELQVPVRDLALKTRWIGVRKRPQQLEGLHCSLQRT